MSEIRTYKPFVMEDIFDLFTGALISNDKIEKGNIPRITATENNNGIALFTKEIDDKNFRTFDNFISISFLGDVFYQQNKTSLDMKIHGIKPKNKELNKYIAQFLIPLLRNFSSKYSYGNQLSMRLLKRQKVNLPITSQNKPDWEYMEHQGKTIYNKKNEIIIEYVKNKYFLLKNKIREKNIRNINDVTWQAFKLLDFFEPKRGNQNNMASLFKGDIPLVSARKFENGYKDFVTSPEKPLYEGNIITLNNDGDGGAGISYYQPYKMALDTHVTALYPTITLNKYHLLFITRTITHQRSKFGNNYPINNLRLTALKIMLPITNENSPDWEYMELYMKKIEYEQLSKLIKYLN